AKKEHKERAVVFADAFTGGRGTLLFLKTFPESLVAAYDGSVAPAYYNAW
ncbi:unnamed protein product, partial [marine sediment metagenome]